MLAAGVLLSQLVHEKTRTFVTPRLHTPRASEIIAPRRPSRAVLETTASIPSPAPAPVEHRTRVSHEQTFLDNLDLIEAVIDLISRRQRLTSAEGDDFRAVAHLRLIENDYEVLRRFEQRSSLRTYLTIVLQRVFLDYRISQWGKWRPSVEAKRLGSAAVLLEQLTTRDGYSFDEAVEVLWTSHRVTDSRDILYGIAQRLPIRISRRPQGEEAFASIADDSPLPDGCAARLELRPYAGRAHESLSRAVAALNPQDRLIIRLRYENGLSIVEIARTLRLEQKPLYRRFEHLKAQLRKSLEADGVDAEFVADLLDESWSDLVDSPNGTAGGRGKNRNGSI
jgi:RNA polymerase sigma factor (sigma-70 family)